LNKQWGAAGKQATFVSSYDVEFFFNAAKEWVVESVQLSQLI